MPLLQSLNLEHLPASHAVHVALYRGVKNASFLQQQLLAGNTDFEYALIDAGVVSTHASYPSPFSPSSLLSFNFRDLKAIT
jgi:EKC/KEOPS complex subunit CGI121/TPRKB